MPAPITTTEADLADPAHADAVVELLRGYARDPMGMGADLSEEARGELVPGLKRHPGAVVLLAYRGTEAVGLAICFLGFSTFLARPQINVHDFAVEPTCRRRGVGRRLMEHVEAKARQLDCCRITLEVRQDNHVAQGLYRSVGFDGADDTSDGVPMLFWKKTLA